MATKPEVLVVKDEVLVVSVTILVTILNPGMAFKYYACVKPEVL